MSPGTARISLPHRLASFQRLIATCNVRCATRGARRPARPAREIAAAPVDRNPRMTRDDRGQTWTRAHRVPFGRRASLLLAFDVAATRCALRSRSAYRAMRRSALARKIRRDDSRNAPPRLLRRAAKVRGAFVRGAAFRPGAHVAARTPRRFSTTRVARPRRKPLPTSRTPIVPSSRQFNSRHRHLSPPRARLEYSLSRTAFDVRIESTGVTS